MEFEDVVIQLFLNKVRTRGNVTAEAIPTLASEAWAEGKLAFATWQMMAPARAAEPGPVRIEGGP